MDLSYADNDNVQRLGSDCEAALSHVGEDEAAWI